MRTHVIVAPTHAIMSSVGLARDVLGVAASEAAIRGSEPPARVLLASSDGGPVRSWNGITMTVDCGLADITTCELAWVSGFWGTPARGLAENPLIPAWLEQVRSGGALVAAHGPGVFLAAEAGLLDHRLATAYVEHAAEFAQRYPAVDLQTARPLTDGGGVFSAVGMNSGADLLVHIIERLHGRAIAASIAQWALVDSQRNYAGAMMAFDGQKYHGDAEVVVAQELLEQSAGEPISITRLAAMCGMSPRTLTRRFKAATGDTPSEYLGRVRVEVAKELFHQTQLSIAEISARVGYRDVGAFYALFARLTGLRPGRYREAQPLISAGRTAEAAATPERTSEG